MRYPNAAIDEQIGPLVKSAAPGLLNVFGVGIDTAAVLLVTAGDNPERIITEAEWAMLCGIAPVPASTGKSDGRYRLNSGGDRQAKNAIWRIVITRVGQHEPRTITGLPETPATTPFTNIGASISRTLFWARDRACAPAPERACASAAAWRYV